MKPLRNVSASVHQRLLNLSRQSGRPFNELAQFYPLKGGFTGSPVPITGITLFSKEL